jgi:quercetin dioxygenase-like cupin family protein
MNSFWLFGTKLNIIGDQEVTGVDFDFIEGFFPPGAQSPVHVHNLYSETLYLLEGQLTVFIPGEETTLGIGDSYFIPPGVPHCIVNASQDLPFRALVVASTNGFSKLVRAVGIPVTGGDMAPETPHDMNLAMEVMTEVGDSIIAPPGGRP